MTKRELAKYIYEGVPHKTIYKDGKSWELSMADPIKENFTDCRYIRIPATDWKSQKSVIEFLTEFDNGDFV